MIIGIDFDETFTLAPYQWLSVIQFFRQNGHVVHLVTWRTPQEMEEVDRWFEVGNNIDGVFPTSRKAKMKHMEGKGIYIDVWIDDNPAAILYDMPTYNSGNGLWN